MSYRPGPLNLITDVDGISIGNAHDDKVMSGVTVILPDPDAIASVDVRGGAPATRETDALDPSSLVESVHAVVLSGGSVFGLDSATGVTQWLSDHGRGFTFATQPRACPVVPSACLFDILNGGDKAWGPTAPYRQLGIDACERASSQFSLGNVGAGYGALAGRYKGGLGSASAVIDGITVGAIVAVNSFGSPVIPGTNRFWAQLAEIDGEFGGLAGLPMELTAASRSLTTDTKAAMVADAAAAGANTTIAVVATDARLTPSEAKRFAVMATDGFARALRPVHTPFDGDTVFALATGRRELEGPRPLALAMLGAAASDSLARAIARGVYEAETLGPWLSYRQSHRPA
ncbi:L-aminopeptidase/D-esterase-like protein [Rhodoligotrophos appendicifer]|uniref:P1 family peptidase n=1 Tax=Rhodoligotrophos appendicifer TaxID=987056 RepID=UPI00118593F3|nr:P1 family peptidase [Rhodoligotrophos appendicifer]